MHVYVTQISGLARSTGDAVLKFEPFVLHVQCRRLEDAQLMVTITVVSDEQMRQHLLFILCIMKGSGWIFQREILFTVILTDTYSLPLKEVLHILIHQLHTIGVTFFRHFHYTRQ